MSDKPLNILDEVLGDGDIFDQLFGSLKTGARNIRKTRPRGYIDNYRPQNKTLKLLDQVEVVLDEYSQYWPLTIRQVFYRLVGRFDFPKNEASYERLCNHMSNARRARLVPFEAIRDDGVVTRAMQHFADTEAFRMHIRELGENYRKYKMASQPRHIEVWCEAAGMIHQMAAVTYPYSIRVYSSSGFDSTTAKKDIADRICEIGKPAIILHLGDYDPSGEALFEAVAEDVTAFVDADKPWNTVDVEFRRVALTAGQVRDYELPTAPAKPSDSRTKNWLGAGTCQLEALAPDQIASLLRMAIEDLLDPDLFNSGLRQEKAERTELTHLLTGPKGIAASRETEGSGDDPSE